MQIVAIDDEKIALEGILAQVKKILPKAQVNGFRNPLEALDFIKENQVDIALCDVEMREMNGIETAKKIKDLKAYLETALNGQKYKDARCSIYFSRSAPAVRFADDDEHGFIEWAKTNAPEYLVYAEPSVNKTKLKEDINSGLEFSKATLESSTYIVIK
jgi:CheY-like chemotaxis protein